MSILAMHKHTEKCVCAHTQVHTQVARVIHVWLWGSPEVTRLASRRFAQVPLGPA